MVKKRGSPDIFALEQEAARLPPLLALLTIDSALFDDDGIGVHLGARRDGQTLMEEVIELTKHGKTPRQALFDVGTRVLGTPPTDLSRAVPGLITPAGATPEDLAAFLDRIGERLRAGHLLVLGDVETLLDLEISVCPFDNPDPPGCHVVASMTPGHYAYLVEKSEKVRHGLGVSSREFQRAILIDETLPRGSAGAIDAPEDPSQIEEVIADALYHLSKHLVPSGDAGADHRRSRSQRPGAPHRSHR